jgi:DNA polymerase-3 subunit beta
VVRESLLKPLALAAGGIGGKHMPILACVLVEARENRELVITGTDLEVELVGRTIADDVIDGGEVAVPARKLLDI